MPTAGPPITLGSASPRRAALLDSIDVDYVVDTVALDEDALVAATEHDPVAAVSRIARAKFAAFPRSTERPSTLLTADTLVACDGSILSKPGSPDDLRQMLRSMSGNSVEIATAVCVGDRGAEPVLETVTTHVRLRVLTADEIEWYLATGTGMDKAGGLALQAEAGRFIESVEGCWANVLGLPLCAVDVLLDRTQDAAPARARRCVPALCGSSVAKQH